MIRDDIIRMAREACLKLCETNEFGYDNSDAIKNATRARVESDA
jgi:hypothetical protein